MRELRVEDQASFFNFLRMPPEMFDELLARIGPRIQKQDTRYRKALEPGLKLAVTIRHRLPLSFGGIVDANTATMQNTMIMPRTPRGFYTIVARFFRA